MQLDNIPQAWSRTLSAEERFGRVMPTDENSEGEAVLDRETGLVWEQRPSGSPLTWFQALGICYGEEVGGRKGWRLPTVEELASLVDRSQFNPALPAGHPFDNVQSAVYWSATTVTALTALAWRVNFNSGAVSNDNKVNDGFVWCVRGQGNDAFFHATE